MREIKFRIWRDSFTMPNGKAKTGAWLSGCVIGAENGHVYSGDCSEHHFEKHGGILHLEQWTGILGKDDKEIYEGDILKNTRGELYEVRYSKGGNRAAFECVYFCERLGGYVSVGFIGSNWQLEVIGNIHENPGLLDSTLKKD